MKKRAKSKDFIEAPQAVTDVADLIIKMQQQLSFLEKKIDTLISQSGEKSFERKDYSKPFQRFDRSHRHGESRQESGFRDRVLHKAVCAECNKECEVPFKPSGERPVYCKDCFSKRKGGGSFNERSGNRPERGDFSQERHFDKQAGHGSRKHFDKKRHGSKKRRKD